MSKTFRVDPPHGQAQRFSSPAVIVYKIVEVELPDGIYKGMWTGDLVTIPSVFGPAGERKTIFVRTHRRVSAEDAPCEVLVEGGKVTVLLGRRSHGG